MKINFEKIKSLIGLFAFIAVIILITLYSSQFFGDTENIKNLLTELGIFAPIIFLLIQFVQVIVAPISHYAIQIAGGAIFGVWLGGILNYVGSTLGSIVAFVLARKYGKPLVKKIVNKSIIDKYEQVIQKIGPFGLFLIYFLPIFPDDEIIYLVGLSKMKFKDFLSATLLGRITGMFGMALVGATMAQSVKMAGFIVIILSLITAIIFFFFRKKLREWYNKRFFKKTD